MLELRVICSMLSEAMSGRGAAYLMAHFKDQNLMALVRWVQSPVIYI